VQYTFRCFLLNTSCSKKEGSKTSVWRLSVLTALYYKNWIVIGTVLILLLWCIIAGLFL
jgi:hypothetical protein